ncbi:LysR family transcriptional regulator [Humitalea sp. 24SJ18S-53]|uniref:LysR family transcriptional regulator n=1 Tax=Humitalea sp. 24SJ18S-53 TaxID=3422307 RepID=UPI003D669313
MDVSVIAGFIAVVEGGSVHAAARQLRISQPTLSRRLQRLEAELGFRLFIRTGRRLVLTEAGIRLLPELREHLEGLQQAFVKAREEMFYGLPTTTLCCLPSVATTALPAVLKTYLRRRPQARLRLLDLSAIEITRLVAAGSADFGVNILGDETPGLVQEVIGEDRMVLVTSLTHPLAERTTLPWSALEGTPLIAIGTMSGNRRMLDSVRARIGVGLNWQHEVQHIATAVQLAADDVAPTIVPQLAVVGRREGVRCIPLVDPPLMRRIGIQRRQGEALSAEAEALRRAVLTGLRRLLAGAATAAG